ncbi:MAG: hypothetical protein K2G44_04165, partial [Clostridia bacterium]|nr:hypothetical protein [Clostridia bacterium]
YKRNTFYYSEENNFEYISYINFSLNSPARDEVTYFIIGLPSEDFSNGGAEEHIIPYAIYNFN